MATTPEGAERFAHVLDRAPRDDRPARCRRRPARRRPAPTTGCVQAVRRSSAACPAESGRTRETSDPPASGCRPSRSSFEEKRSSSFVCTSVWIFDSRVQRRCSISVLISHTSALAIASITVRDREPLNRVTPHLDRALLRVEAVEVPLVVGAEEVRGIVLDFRVLCEERGQRGIGLQIRLVGQAASGPAATPAAATADTGRGAVRAPSFVSCAASRALPTSPFRLAPGRAGAGRRRRPPRPTGR